MRAVVGRRQEQMGLVQRQPVQAANCMQLLHELKEVGGDGIFDVYKEKGGDYLWLPRSGKGVEDRMA